MKYPAYPCCAATLGLLLTGALRAQSVSDPHVTSWITSKSAQYARVYETASDKSSGNAVSTWPRSGLTNGGGGQATATYSDIQRVAYSSNFVYIYTTGLASYTMGNWVTPNNMVYTSWPTNRAAIHRIPRSPTIPTTKQKNNGNGGVLVNGVFVWQNGDAQSYTTSTGTVSMSGQGIWNRLAGVAEAFNFDPANGHQPSSGAYHNHINPKALRYQLGDNVTYNSSTKTYSESGTPTKHSPIIGWANDGLPIYGPYGYSTAMDATSGIRRMVSGFVKRDGSNGTTNLATTGRVTLPVWAASVQGKSQTLASTEYGPSTTATYSVGGGVTATYSIGVFAEDYEYLGDLGKTQGTDFDLNRQNVRFCVTPEYPSGTYAYFTCIDSSGATVFPDVINQEYFGSAAMGTGTVTSISESVTDYFKGGPAAPITIAASASNGSVVLSWNSAEGATYKVEGSADNSTWTTLSSAVTSGGTTTNYTAATSNYYRVTLSAIATYDTSGTFGTAMGTSATYAYNAVAAPSITTHPSSATVVVGGSANFTVVASGTAPLSYQWRKDGSPISGATNASYAIASAQSTDAGSYTCVVTNSVGSVTSNAATLAVNAAATAPSITTQPVSISVTTGSSATFTVAASGTAPLSYQWRKDGNPISGASAASYAIASAQASDAGSYTCVVTNSAGSTTSNAATLTITSTVTAPNITTQPASASVTAGSGATFTVVASGTAPLSYQWRKEGTAISGATSASYTISNAQASDAGSYTCVITNSAGSATSNAATLTVNPAVSAPTIATQPVDTSVLAGTSASFTVVANGTAPLAYQWRRNGTAITGATAATVTIASAQANDAGTYTCVISNSAGSVTSNGATLIVTTAVVAPGIVGQPTSVSAAIGGGVTFTVTATGTAPLTYQWRKDGAVIPGATAAILTLTNLQAVDAASYSCVVSNSAGAVTSSSATLTITSNATVPAITVQPANTTATAGGSITFAIAATGTAPLSYQWRKDGSALVGSTAASFTIASVQASDAGTYVCVVSNSAGAATSSGAVLTVTAATVAPTIVSQPANVSSTVGASATFTVVANGTAPLSYQWRKDGTTIAPATAATFAIDVLRTTDAGSYTCVITNSAGSITTSAATLTVAPASVVETGPVARIINLAVRARIGGVAGTATTGFAIGGAGPAKRIIVRAVGPTLGGFGVSGTLRNPQLQLWSGGTMLASNDDWLAADAPAFAAVGAFPLAAASADAAIVTPLATGTYTTPISDPTGSSGIVLIECYDGAPADTSVRLVNASALAYAGTGDDALIPGFVISGEGNVRVLVRAVGPGLAAFGVAGTMPDPKLTLFSGTTVVGANNDWEFSSNASEVATAAQAVGAFALAPRSADAALLVSLPAGAYTANVSPSGEGAGLVLVEVYVVP